MKWRQAWTLFRESFSYVDGQLNSPGVTLDNESMMAELEELEQTFDAFMAAIPDEWHHERG